MNGKKPENQEEMLSVAQWAVPAICAKKPDTMNALMHPEFVDCDFEEATLTLAYKAEAWMSNPVGMMHGGNTAAAADITMGILTYILAGQVMPPTITMQVTYLRPIPIGSTLVVKARADSVGKTKAALVADMWLEGQPNKRCATATGVYYTAGPSVKDWKYEKTSE